MFHIPLTKRSPSSEDPAVSDGVVVFWTDIFLLGIFGVFALASIPRAVFRFSHRTERWKGLFLFHTTAGLHDGSGSTSSRDAQQPSASSHGRSSTGLRSDGIVHKASLSSQFYGVSCFLRAQPIPGYPVGKTFLLILYFAVLLFAALYRDNVFNNPDREGAIVASQLPWVYALATKNNAIGALLGYGYEKLNFLHRWVGTLLVLAANVHAIGFIYQWVMQGTWVLQLEDPTYRWGVVALVSIDILFVFSLPIIRQHFYNLFYYTHLVALIVLLVAISLHQSFAIPYVAIAAGLYGADRVIRIFKSRIATAYIQPVFGLGSTLVRIPYLNRGWKAGQHVRVRILSLSGWRGILGWAETHPYTIVNACDGVGEGGGLLEGGGATLLVKKTGGWSERLYSLALGSSKSMDNDSETAIVSGLETGRKVRVLIDGPYGGPGHTVFSSFSGVMLVTGGSGISYSLAVTQELLQHAASSGGGSNIVSIEIIWCVRHLRALEAMLPTFASLLRMSQQTSPPIQLTIRTHYTRALSPIDPDLGQLSTIPDALVVNAGRPPLRALINELLDRTISSICTPVAGKEGLTTAKPRGHGVAIAVCGPAALGADVRHAMQPPSAGGVVDKARRKLVGGVEVYEEAFHW